MKIQLVAGTLAIALILSGCGKETTTTKSEGENKQEHNTSIQETKSSGEIQAEYLAEQNAKIKVKTVDEKSYGLHDPDTDDNTISYFAVIKNESKKSVDVSEINISYVDKDGTVIGQNDSSSVFVSPYILKPGQKAYVSAETYIDVPYTQYENVDMNVSPMMTTDKVKNLPIDGDSIRAENNNVVYLTGKTKNTTQNPINYITVGAAIYGKNHEFLGTTFDSKELQLNPGQSTPFESTSPKISNEDLAKAETYEVFAYTYPNK